MKIVLIGFACSYKTTAGKLLAKKLNCSHMDTDETAERIANKKIADIFAEEGEKAFRKIENDVILSLISLDNVVISCGGGSALAEGFKKLSVNSTVVWLKVNVQNVKARLGGQARPLFDGKTVAELEELISTRNACYKKYADVVVDTNGLSSGQVAERIYSKLTARGILTL